MSRRAASLLLCLGLFLALQAPGRASDWPGWRGPTGLGYTDEKDLPLTWDGKTDKNIVWKTLLHGGGKTNPEFASPGWSSPIVCRERVIITTAVWPAGTSQEERKKTIAEHHVLCFQASDGKQLWDTVVPAGRCLVDNFYHGYAVPTPVTDGERIYALFGSAVMAALDFEGKIIWREELPHPRDVDGGICSSPLLYEDSVVIVGLGDASLRALDKKTGKPKWEQNRKERARFTTPVLVRIDGKPQLIHVAGNGVQGLDPATGDLVWSCQCPISQASAAFGSGLVYADPGVGGNSQTGTLVDPTGKGNVSKTHVKWQIKGTPGAAGSSPIIVDDLVYRAGHPGVFKCWKLATGELVFDERTPKISPCSSPIATPDGRIYIASPARSYVFKAGPTFEILATNELNDGADYTTPAVSGGRIYIKGKSYLWCIGSKDK